MKMTETESGAGAVYESIIGWSSKERMRITDGTVAERTGISDGAVRKERGFQMVALDGIGER